MYIGYTTGIVVAISIMNVVETGYAEGGQTKRQIRNGRPRGNGRPHSQGCHRSVRSMFTWGPLRTCVVIVGAL